jgi:hypothetical protein
MGQRLCFDDLLIDHIFRDGIAHFSGIGVAFCSRYGRNRNCRYDCEVIVGIIGYVKRPEPSATTHSGLPEKAYVANCIKHGVNLGGRYLDCSALSRFASRFGCALGRFRVMFLSGFRGVFTAFSHAA